MSRIQLRFKDPDAINAFLVAAVPGSWDDEKVQKVRHALSAKFFEFGDYGCVEVDAKTWCGKLIPVDRWE